MRNLRVSAGDKYACPVCGNVFTTAHAHGAVNFLNTCDCMGSFQDGFVQVDESKIQYPELITRQEKIMWVLNSVRALPPTSFTTSFSKGQFNGAGSETTGPY